MYTHLESRQLACCWSRFDSCSLDWLRRMVVSLLYIVCDNQQQHTCIEPTWWRRVW